MAERPETATGRDVLLATKLYMPVSRPGQVSRPRLTTRLDEGLSQGLVLVCAPAGYGKTVLLADWTRRGRQPVAWLSLDGGTTTRPGSGATWWPRLTGPALGPATGWPRCSGRPRHRRSRGWSRR
jgi:hypothetical protein